MLPAEVVTSWSFMFYHIIGKSFLDKVLYQLIPRFTLFGKKMKFYLLWPIWPAPTLLKWINKCLWISSDMDKFRAWWKRQPSYVGRASRQERITRQRDRQTNNLQEGAKYAAKKYLPPPSKMSGVTFHCSFIIQTKTFCSKLGSNKWP